uniref:Putative secreted protein n=1 Tax=Anopheles marajoara TaxID=58244 RepID=A0A2M4CCW1_9DIPT
MALFFCSYGLVWCLHKSQCVYINEMIRSNARKFQRISGTRLVWSRSVTQLSPQRANGPAGVAVPFHHGNQIFQK